MHQRKKPSMNLLFLFWFMVFVTPVFGLVTAYVSFEHPDGWRCELSQGVWICQSTLEPDRKESVVLSIATMRTEWDSLDNYLEYLKKPRKIQDEEGNTITSKVIYARKRSLSGITWVDSLQKNAELPGFWARYVATVQDKLAILITYIVSEEYYSKLAPQFERMVSSLKPNAEFDLNIATKQGEQPLPGTELLGKKRELIAHALGLGKRKKPKKVEPVIPKEEEQPLPLGLIAIGVACLILFIILKRRKKAKAAKKGIATRR